MAALDIKNSIDEIKSSFFEVLDSKSSESDGGCATGVQAGVRMRKNAAENSVMPSLGIVIYESSKYSELNSVIKRTDFDYLIFLRKEFVEDALVPGSDIDVQIDDDVTVWSFAEAAYNGVLDANAAVMLLSKCMQCNLDMLVFGEPQSNKEYCGLFSGQQFFVKTHTYADKYCAQSWPAMISTYFLKDKNVTFEADSGLPEIAFGIKCITLAKRVMTCKNPFCQDGEVGVDIFSDDTNGTIDANEVCSTVNTDVSEPKNAGTSQHQDVDVSVSTYNNAQKFEFAPLTLKPTQKLMIDNAVSKTQELLAFIKNICAFINTQSSELENNFAKCLLRTLFECISKIQQGITPLDEELIFKASDNTDFETILGLFLLRNTVARWKYDTELAAKNQEIEQLQNSTSMKAGLAVTAPFRKFKDAQQHERTMRGSTQHKADSAKTDDVKLGSTRSDNTDRHQAVQNNTQHAEQQTCNHEKGDRQEHTPHSGLTVAKRVPQVIASFTSYPMRLDTIGPTVISLANQTQKFDRIVLWLAKSQFPDQHLPKSMEPLFDLGLEVMWCEQDIKSYKRSICSFEAFPDDILVFFDDDLKYREDCLETLLTSYSKHPNAINAHRVRKMQFSDDGSLAPYPTWGVEHTSYIDEPRMDLLATNGGGTLYPPHIMPAETQNVSKFMQLAPTADDIWLKFMQVIAGAPVVFASEFEELEYTDGTQEVCALYDDNAGKNLNDKAIASLVEEYNEFHGSSDTLLARMRSNV